MTHAPAMTLHMVEAGGLGFYAREGTTDLKVIPEVVTRQAYIAKGFLEIDSSDRWLDLGANIGTFTVLAASKGAQVRAYEPEPENVSLLTNNVQLNSLGRLVQINPVAVTTETGGTVSLYLCSGTYNRYRHTLRPVRGRRSIPVRAVPLASLLDGWPNAIKIDIEGAEIGMLSDPGNTWPGITKMALEYDFDQDRSITRFERRMARLRELGFEVRHKPMPRGKTSYDFWPSGVLVHAVRSEARGG